MGDGGCKGSAGPGDRRLITGCLHSRQPLLPSYSLAGGLGTASPSCIPTRSPGGSQALGSLLGSTKPHRRAPGAPTPQPAPAVPAAHDLPDAVGCPGMLWYVMGCRRILWDAAGCHGMLRDAAGRCGMLRGIAGCCRCHGMLQDAAGCCGLLPATVGYCEMLQNAMGCCGMSRKAAGCRGIFWDAAGCHGMLWGSESKAGVNPEPSRAPTPAGHSRPVPSSPGPSATTLQVPPR